MKKSTNNTTIARASTTRFLQSPATYAEIKRAERVLNAPSVLAPEPSLPYHQPNRAERRAIIRRACAEITLIAADGWRADIRRQPVFEMTANKVVAEYSAPVVAEYSAPKVGCWLPIPFIDKGNGGAVDSWRADIRRQPVFETRAYKVIPCRQVAEYSAPKKRELTLYGWARVIVNSALKTVYSKAKSENAEGALYSLFNDKADLIQTAALALTECGLTENAHIFYAYSFIYGNGYAKRAYKAVNHIIYAERAKQYKTRVFENAEYGENGEIIARDYIRAISYFPTYDTLDTENARALLDKLQRGLTPTEFKVLRAICFEGKKARDLIKGYERADEPEQVRAARLACSEANISKTLKRAREKARAIIEG